MSRPDEDWLREQYQLAGRDPADIADELDVRPRRVREWLSELQIGEPEMLLRTSEGIEAALEYHGSKLDACEALGVSMQRLRVARRAKE